ncbi:Uncharacterized protein FWK35_00023739 [Aphis craccivora]|uniref:Uncharacterized protein n=1 Tax=Aphis craccivora TaxID=307492 RepID=A0A6G0XZ88_APHCR|nr:Uncharacterized protein FWK35_00023739 [Aphis craccivora]
MVAVLKNKRMAWTEHVWRPKQRWIDKVEKNLAEIGLRDGETIAQDIETDGSKFVLIMGLNGL